MQIPLLMAGHGIPAGQACEQLVSNIDIAPTLMELCGIDSGRRFHGRSMAPLIRNHDSRWRRGLMAQPYGLQEPIVQRAWYQDHLKLVIRQDGYRELYDLARDSGELENLALKAGHRGELELMEQGLIRAMDAVDDDNERIVRALETRPAH